MTTARIVATLDKVTDVKRVATAWTALEPWCESSLFQSSIWVAPWMDAALREFDLRWVRAERDGVIVGLGLVVPRRVRRRLFQVNTLFVNEAGPSHMDFCIEHNGFLLHRDYEEETLLAMVRCLREHLSWDELHFRRATCGGALHRLLPAQLSPMGLRLRRGDENVAPYVDLDAVRTSGKDFVEGLTSNRRGQIRRALRRLEQHGPLSIHAAENMDEAMDYFSGLKHYHQAHWEERGEAGAFANPQWEAFHRRLIGEQLPLGGIQMFHVRAGGSTVGYIYNLVQARYVYMIQSGFNYDLDPKGHPGECCHVLAIEWNLRAGNRVYDFLAGDMRYKRSLANGIVSMDGVVLQRKRWRFLVEDTLRAVYHRFQGAGERAPAA